MSNDRKRRFEVEDCDTRFTKHSSGFSSSIVAPPGLSFFKPNKSGSMNLDIIPYIVTENILKFDENIQFARPGKLYYERTFYSHMGIGVNQEWVVCPARTFHKPCPICEELSQIKRSNSKEDQDRAKELKPKDRQVFLIYDTEDTDKGIQLWEVSNWNFGRHLDRYIQGASKRDLDKYKRFFDPYNGFTVRINPNEVAMGTGKNTEFIVHSFSGRDELPEKLIEHGFDLDGMVTEMSYDKIKALFEGIDPDEDNDNKELESKEPTRTVSAPETKQEAKSEPKNDKPAEKPKNRLKAATKDKVKFPFQDEVLTGIVERVDEEKHNFHVKVEGERRPFIVDMDDVTVIETDATFDLVDKDKPKEKSASKDEQWDDPDGDRTYKGGKK